MGAVSQCLWAAAGLTGLPSLRRLQRHARSEARVSTPSRCPVGICKGNLTPRCTQTRLVCHALCKAKVAPACGAPVSASVKRHNVVTIGSCWNLFVCSRGCRCIRMEHLLSELPGARRVDERCRLVEPRSANTPLVRLQGNSGVPEASKLACVRITARCGGDTARSPRTHFLLLGAGWTVGGDRPPGAIEMASTCPCRLTPRSSGRGDHKVPSSDTGARAAQLNRYVTNRAIARDSGH